jgi:hypothetical protein
VIGWLRRFGLPRSFAPEDIPGMLAKVHAEYPALRQWVSHPVYASTSAVAAGAPVAPVVGRCRLTVSKPELKARLVSALETRMR